MKTVRNKVDINSSISIIIFNVNGLNVPTRLSEWIKKYWLGKCHLQETHFQYKDTYKLKVNEWEKYTLLTLIKKKKAGVASYTNFKQSRL